MDHHVLLIHDSCTWLTGHTISLKASILRNVALCRKLTPAAQDWQPVMYPCQAPSCQPLHFVFKDTCCMDTRLSIDLWRSQKLVPPEPHDQLLMAPCIISLTPAQREMLGNGPVWRVKPVITELLLGIPCNVKVFLVRECLRGAKGVIGSIDVGWEAWPIKMGKKYWFVCFYIL